jgi:N-acetyl-anhydromuramyl-L-alanine amidase AmpD
MIDWRPTRIILHCSATEDGPGSSLEAIRRYHKEVNGWSDIGYHYLLEWVGEQFVLRPGRPWWIRGAHCKAAGRNNDSLGVCVVGQFDSVPPTASTRDYTVQALAWLCLAFDIHPDRVHGHREFEPGKLCPGARWPLEETRRLVSLTLHSAGGPQLVMGRCLSP